MKLSTEHLHLQYEINKERQQSKKNNDKELHHLANINSDTLSIHCDPLNIG